jgi:translation initiation factor 1 (eIF-1/SUI1)
LPLRRLFAHDRAIEFQGDLRDRIREFLLKKGFGVKG